MHFEQSAKISTLEGRRFVKISNVLLGQLYISAMTHRGATEDSQSKMSVYHHK